MQDLHSYKFSPGKYVPHRSCRSHGSRPAKRARLYTQIIYLSALNGLGHQPRESIIMCPRRAKAIAEELREHCALRRGGGRSESQHRENVRDITALGTNASKPPYALHGADCSSRERAQASSQEPYQYHPRRSHALLYRVVRTIRWVFMTPRLLRELYTGAVRASVFGHRSWLAYRMLQWNSF